MPTKHFSLGTFWNHDSFISTERTSLRLVAGTCHSRRCTSRQGKCRNVTSLHAIFCSTMQQSPQWCRTLTLTHTRTQARFARWRCMRGASARVTLMVLFMWHLSAPTYAKCFIFSLQSIRIYFFIVFFHFAKFCHRQSICCILNVRQITSHSDGINGNSIQFSFRNLLSVGATKAATKQIRQSTQEIKKNQFLLHFAFPVHQTLLSVSHSQSEERKKCLRCIIDIG